MMNYLSMLRVSLFSYFAWGITDEYDYNSNYDLYGGPSFQWCCLKCDTPHVMCQHAVEGHGFYARNTLCARTDNQTFPDVPIAELVGIMNAERRQLARRANISNMQFLQTNSTLTVFAQLLSSYCNPLPKLCLDTDQYRVKPLTYNTTTDKNVTAKMIVDYWKRGRLTFLENYHNQLYTNNSMSQETDDYTLLMWGASAEIGCANTYSRDNTTTSTRQVTCLIGPAGNIEGEAIWELGVPCTNCAKTRADWIDQKGYCRDDLCFAQLPRWPRDENRLANCKAPDEEVDETEYLARYGLRGNDDGHPYAKGVMINLKPRFICDPISAADNSKSKRWIVLAALTFSLRKSAS